MNMGLKDGQEPCCKLQVDVKVNDDHFVSCEGGDDGSQYFTANKRTLGCKLISSLEYFCFF